MLVNLLFHKYCHPINNKKFKTTNAMLANRAVEKTKSVLEEIGEIISGNDIKRLNKIFSSKKTQQTDAFTINDKFIKEFNPKLKKIKEKLESCFKKLTDKNAVKDNTMKPLKQEDLNDINNEINNLLNGQFSYNFSFFNLLSHDVRTNTELILMYNVLPGIKDTINVSCNPQAYPVFLNKFVASLKMLQILFDKGMK